MPRIDKSLTFYPPPDRGATISDSRSMRPTLRLTARQRLCRRGPQLVGKSSCPDEIEAIRLAGPAWRMHPRGRDHFNGGTGFAPRDVTPEAVKPLFRREMDGFSVLFHQASIGTVGLSTLQSRAFAGQIDETFIFCLPGSTGACRDGWDLVLAQELDSRYRPCSLAGQIPRLRSVCA